MRIAVRSTPSAGWSLISYAIAALASLFLTAVLIAIVGAPIAASLAALVNGAFGSYASIMSSVVKAAPLVLTGLATCIAYRAGLWSVGQEGQVIAGAAAAWQASLWTSGLPPALAIALCALAGVAGVAALGGLSAWLKVRFAMSEIVSTMMLNYIVFYALSWLISGPWMAAGGTASYQQTSQLPKALWLPTIAGAGKIHIGIAVALLAVVWLHVVLKRTALGYEIRAMGLNATALAQRGVDMPRLILKVMMISGAISGIAGLSEAFGVTHRISGENLAGIIIAIIGGLSPVRTLLAGLFFGGLHNGALFMNVMTGVPTALVTAIQGIVLILFLVAGVASRYTLERETLR